MQRIVIDTNIYIDWLNEGRYEDIIFQREAVKHLSADVLMELLAGAFSTRDRRLIRDITLPFAKANRIVTPTVSIYEEAGDVLRRLQRLHGYSMPSAYGLVNDCTDCAIGSLDRRECDHPKRARLCGYSIHAAI